MIDLLTLGWFSKSCLWSFKDINAGVAFIGSMRLDIFKSSAMVFSSWLISVLILSEKTKIFLEALIFLLSFSSS